MKHGFASTSQGRIHYLEAGNGQPLILLHSNGGPAYQYEEVIASFAQRWHVFAIDMPGHGDSDRITAHTSIEKYAQAVVAFMDALKIEKAAVAGDSVGGSICLPLARDRGALSQRHAGAAETLEHRPQRGRRVQANVAVLPECGHFPMIDDPPLFVREVNRLTDAVAR